jgi:hypothetical protein
VRVRARRLHDGRGVGRRSRQEAKSRHRSRARELANEGRRCPLFDCAYGLANVASMTTRSLVPRGERFNWEDPTGPVCEIEPLLTRHQLCEAAPAPGVADGSILTGNSEPEGVQNLVRWPSAYLAT